MIRTGGIIYSFAAITLVMCYIAAAFHQPFTDFYSQLTDIRV